MSKENKLLFLIFFNVLLMALEFAGGLISGSLALLSDASHMLMDSFAVFLSYLAFYWSKKPSTEEKTFGYHRLEIIAAFINSLILFAISGYIMYEAVLRFFHPQPIKAGILLVIAILGLLGNLTGIFLLKKEKEENLNVQGAYLHLLSDSLSSIGVITGGLIIFFTGLNIFDSIIGIGIALIVLKGGFGLFMESVDILLESVPKHIDLAGLQKEVEEIHGIKEFHDIHIWTITSNRTALSGHILTDNINTRQSQEIINKVKSLLFEKFGINHTTIEVECENCKDNDCEYK
ncbi:MAG: cation diffusion facilitator family transporter [Elusimicrobia bacterium]|nr:cation diffusion facilitator family transporter [Candidatus Liberimonas magnetica]